MLVARGQPKGSTGFVLKMICGGIVKYKKKRFYPSQKHMLELLGKYADLDMARSTLNLWLNYLEEGRWIVRYSGFLRGRQDNGRYRPSSFYLTRKAILWLISCGVKTATLLLGQPVRRTVHHNVTPNRIIGGLRGLLGINQHTFTLKGVPLPMN